MKNEIKKNQEQILKELKRTKEDLADLVTYIKDFSTFLPLPICIINPVKIIIDCNQAADELTGYEEAELIGNEAGLLFKDKQKWQNLENRIFKGEDILQPELILITKDQKEVIVNISAGLKKDKLGEITGYFLALSDITEFKKLQEELEGKVQDRTKQLQERVDELEKFYKITVGREEKMMELKKEIERLKKELEKYKK